MALISVVFDLVGVIRDEEISSVSFWNLVVATVAIFVAIIFGQIEAGLANPYETHTTSSSTTAPLAGLAGVLGLLTGWRYVVRQKDPTICLLAFS